MDEVEGQGHQIVGSQVEIVARVDGIDDAALQAAVDEGGRGLSVLAAPQARGRDASRSAHASGEARRAGRGAADAQGVRAGAASRARRCSSCSRSRASRRRTT